jgi:hypothetical protein
MRYKNIWYKRCLKCRKIFSNENLRGNGKPLSIFQFKLYKFCSKKCRYHFERDFNEFMIGKDKNICFIRIRNSTLLPFFDSKYIKKLSNYTWHIDNVGYVSTSCNNKIPIRLHSMLMGKRKGLMIDHINRNKLDNRKTNLRFVSHTENMWNSKNGDKWAKMI